MPGTFVIPEPNAYRCPIKHCRDKCDRTCMKVGFELHDITYHRAVAHGTVRIAFDRPEVRNAFRPGTVDELYRVLDHARQTPDVGCVLLTGKPPVAR